MKQFRDSDYFVTEEGDVYSKKYHFTKNPNCELRKRKIKVNKNGYCEVGLTIDGKRIFYKVHRLVAECYLSNPKNLPIVEHRDDIKTNNHVSNLMWSTHSNNNKNAYKSGLRKPVEIKGEQNGNSKLTEEQIKWIRDNYIPRHKEFGGISLTKKFGVKKAQISRIVKNETWKHI